MQKPTLRRKIREDKTTKEKNQQREKPRREGGRERDKKIQICLQQGFFTNTLWAIT